MSVIDTLNIGDLITTNPFPDAEYRELGDVLGKPLHIVGAVGFENDKGKGVHVLARIADTKELVRLCTHSVAITNALTSAKVIDALDNGAVINARIVQKKSSTTGRQMFALTNWE